MESTRRAFLQKAMLGTMGASIGFHTFANPQQNPDPLNSDNFLEKSGDFTISIFSKNLHWLGYNEMAVAVKEMGFDGIDLTVRPDGHVEPSKVAEDLPKAVAAIRKAGLEVWMITTAITYVEEPCTEEILKTASSLGIGFYRMGWIQYDDTISVKENLKIISKKLSALAILSKKYNIKAQYQNHSGASFGSPLWDLAQVLTEINSPWMGSQYDVLHAIVEGANSWPLGLKQLYPYIGTMDIKDFIWVQKDGKWKTQTVPLGEGLVDYKKYFSLLKKYNIKGPFSIHYEYPLGGAENGAKVITIPKEDVLVAMKKDLVTLKQLLT